MKMKVVVVMTVMMVMVIVMVIVMTTMMKKVMFKMKVVIMIYRSCRCVRGAHSTAMMTETGIDGDCETVQCSS